MYEKSKHSYIPVEGRGRESEETTLRGSARLLAIGSAGPTMVIGCFESLGRISPRHGFDNAHLKLAVLPSTSSLCSQY